MTAAAAGGGAAPAKSLIRTLATPEGVPIDVELASRGDRAIAFLLDALFITLGIVALVVFLLLTIEAPSAGNVVLSLTLIAFFLLRNFYFTWFEISWSGRTPGKRIVGVRVIDRRGGPLRPDAVVARNLTRELEVFLPFTFAVASDGVFGSEWAQIAAVIWGGIFSLMPLFNRDNLRAGDIIGGTWVVRAPKAMLLGDLAARDPLPTVAGRPVGVGEAAVYTFTTDQLDIYGIYELQVLEDVLRRGDGEETAALREDVAVRIKTKIDWQEPEGVTLDTRRFLTDFYAALRHRLETRMLFGERRERKRETGQGSEPPPSAGRDARAGPAA